MASIGQLKYEITADARKAKAEIKDFDGVLGRLGKNVGGIGSVFAGSFLSGAVTALTSQLTEGVGAIIDYSARLEQTKIGFETLMGGADNAAKHLKDLQQFAAATPFEFESLAGASRRLQNVGLEASKVIPVMKDIGNAAAAAGASSAELDSITLAFSQIIAKGKLSAEEVNQLAERGIPIWKMMSEQLGLSKAQVIKLSEQGKISSDQFLDAFQKFSQMNFGDAMEKQSHTFSGAMSTIKDVAMQTGADAFKPFFNAISHFADDVATSLSSQQAEAKAAGVSFGFAIGEATGKAYRAGLDFGLGRHKTPFGGMFSDLVADFAAGATKGATHQLSIADLLKMADAIGGIKRTIDKVKPLVIQIDPKDEIEKKQKQMKLLSDTVTSLGNQIQFFGDESQVAAIKQKLMGAGIYNFQTGLAKSAISLAAQLDKLTANKKEQDEYNASLKKTRDELQQMRRDSDFKVSFPDATELDRFNRFVQNQVTNFQDLRYEIELTRQSLEADALIDASRKRQKTALGAIRDIQSEAAGLIQPLDEVGQAVSRIVGGINEEGDQSLNVHGVSEKIAGFVRAYHTLRTELGDSDATAKSLAQVREALKAYINTLTFLNVGRLFGDKAGGQQDQFVDALLKLGGAVSDKKLTKGLTDLDQILNKLGLTLGNSNTQEWDELNRALADPDVTAAIRARAAALGMTEEALRHEILRPRLVDKSGRRKKRRRDGEPESQWNLLKEEFDSTAQIAGITALQTAFEGLAQAIGAAVEAWVLYGSVGESAQQVTAKIIAAVAQQATVKAVFELAEGFAALARAFFGDPKASAEAAMHFKSAAIYGLVAGVAAGIGRGVAGDSFKEKGGGAGAAGGSGGGSGRESEPSPYSRVSADAYISGRRSQEQAVAKAIEKLAAKIDGMKPGDVLTAGMRQRPGAVGQQVATDIGRNAAIGRNILSKSGMR